MPRDPITKDQAVNSLDLLRVVVAETTTLNADDFGSCPFHAEATSSFHIFKAKSGRARFHCFGCEASGDVFNFLNKTKQLSFAAAIKYLSGLLDRPVVSASREPGDDHSDPGSFVGLLDTKDGDPPTKFCEKDCPKYAALLEDYNYILETKHEQVNPDLETVPGLVNEIPRLKEYIAQLENLWKKSKTAPAPGFGGVHLFSGAPVGELLDGKE